MGRAQGRPFRPKPLDQQVVVITGASSGIGLATARLAARRGARVVMASFDERPLRQAAEEIEAQGGRALAVPTDVSDPAATEALAHRAATAFGGLDTWVNNAGVHLFGRSDEAPEEDARRLFDVNFWGMVHGARAAIFGIQTRRRPGWAMRPRRP